ncbi:hypothetical protein ABK040_005504 [Willaertia magna]
MNFHQPLSELISEDIWNYNILPHLNLLDIHHLQFINKWFYHLLLTTDKYFEYKTTISQFRYQTHLTYNHLNIYDRSTLYLDEEMFDLYIETCSNKYEFFRALFNGKYGIYIDNNTLGRFSDRFEKILEQFPEALSAIFPKCKNNLSELFTKLFSQERKVLDYLSLNIIQFSDICVKLQNSQPFLLKLIKIFSSKYLKYFDQKFYDNFEILNEALKMDPDAYNFASKRLKEEKEILITLFSNYRTNPTIIKKIVTEQMPKAYYNDNCLIKVVLTAVKKQPICYTYASDRLKEDTEIVLEALLKASKSGIHLQTLLSIIPFNFLFEKDFVMNLLERDHTFFEKITSYELLDDKEVVLIAIRKNGHLLCHASENMKNNKEIVSVAVDTDGDALMYASRELRDDKEIVLKAVRNNGKALLEASERLKGDLDIILEAMKLKVSYISFASKKFKQDENLMNQVLTLYPEAKNFLE